ncbi:MAG: YceI family protein [Candidatus Solibacter sp.]|jgi:polyisoprenoid-binding protein YceI|nr:YceI family protein [Candidatus Solibacter sp.]
MTKRLRLSLVLCAATLLAAGSYTLDPTQTKVEFTLRDVLHTVHGTFQLTTGSLRLDAATGKASGELIVDARTGDSGSKARDKRMHASILESDKFPQITFRPDRVEGKLATDGRSQVQLHGIFAIHGTDHEITVPATVDAAGGAYLVTATFEVPYVKWGMKNPSNLLLRVNDTVEITIHTTARPQ